MRTISTTLSALARLDHPNYLLVETLAQEATSSADELTPKEICSLLMSLLTMRLENIGLVRELWDRLCVPSFLKDKELTTDLLMDMHHTWGCLSVLRPGEFALPADVQHRAVDAWHASGDSHTNTSDKLSALHEEVSTVLREMGVAHITEEKVGQIPMFVDILIESKSETTSRKVVVEVNGPECFTRSPNGELRCVGPSVLKSRILKAEGCGVLAVDFNTWAVQSNDEQKQTLAKFLGEAGLFPV